jgi:hypothetical protein
MLLNQVNKIYGGKSGANHPTEYQGSVSFIYK